VPLYVCNEENYGYITVPLEDNQSLEYDQAQVTNMKLEALGKYQSHDYFYILFFQAGNFYF
jgi:hypothetical protein